MARDLYETARKLRRLTASPNPHEAARAREHYARFVARHGISLDDEPVFAPTLDEALRGMQTTLRELARNQRDADRRARASQAHEDRLTVEYLRFLSRAKREAYLRALADETRARLVSLLTPKRATVAPSATATDNETE